MKNASIYGTLLCLFTLISQFAFSQKIVVKDAQSLQPIDLVNISINGEAITSTNSRGESPDLELQGGDEISFSLLGYKTRSVTFQELANLSFLVYLQELQLNLDQAVVSVNRWNQKKKEVPVKVTAISPKEVQLRNPQTSADLLGQSGEVFIQKSQLGGGSPMIRGFSTNRLLIAVDGIRMNTAIFRGGNLQNVISIDPFSVASTEVVFGPGSVNYGSDAIGGVLSFQTLSPKLSPDDEALIEGSGALRYASASNEQTVHFDIGVGFKKWAFLSSFSHSDFGDLRMGSFGPDEYLRPFYVQSTDSTDLLIRNEDPQVQKPTAYSQSSMMHKLRFTPNNEWNIEAGLIFSTTTNFPRYDRLLRTRDDDPRSARWDYGPQLWMMNTLSIEHDRKTFLYDGMKIKAAYQFFEESRIDRNFNSLEENERIEDVNAYSLNIDFNKQFNEKHQLFYGAEIVLNEVESRGFERDILSGSLQRTSARYPNADWASYAIFTSYQYNPNEKISISAGTRYNAFEIDARFDTLLFSLPFSEASLSNSSLTGSIGAIYEPVPKFNMSFNLGTGFRAPNVDDIGKIFDSEPGRIVVPNDQLRAEYAYNAEFAVGKIFADFLKIDVTAYYTLLDDALVRRASTLNGADSLFYEGELSQVQAIQNAANAEVYGFQAGMELKLPKGFGFISKFNYQFGEEELDDGSTAPLRHAAPWFGVSRLKYESQRILVEFNVQYSGEFGFDDLAPSEQAKDFIYAMDKNGNPYSPAWTIFNLNANYQIDENWSVGAALENMTDQRYRPYSSGIAAAGRNLILSFRTRF